jgi:hypothetical protein
MNEARPELFKTTLKSSRRFPGGSFALPYFT